MEYFPIHDGVDIGERIDHRIDPGKALHRVEEAGIGGFDVSFSLYHEEVGKSFSIRYPLQIKE